MNKEEELKKEIEKKKMTRIFEISEEVWKRFERGEVNLIENLFNEFKEIVKRTNDIEVSKAELKGYQEAKAEILKEIDEVFYKFKPKSFVISNLYKELNSKIKGEK